jgi:glycosyltransferase involved in cell wall biosynthesis
MKICYFGTYEKNYPRNKNVIEGLKINKVEIIECHEPLLDDIEDKINISIFTKIIILFRISKSYLKLVIKKFRLPKTDAVVVGYIGQLDMILARILFPTKKIFFNPMISLYDTMINDRKVSKNFLIKKIFYLLDKTSCLLANKIILDTPEHAKYFIDKFNLSEKKVEYVYIGADDNIFYPIIKAKKDHNFKVLFYGKFTPLQGIDNLIKTANILKKEKGIKFKIIGTGQTYKEIRDLNNKLRLNNITFVDWVPYKDLPKEINNADICIGGHFGLGKKAIRVVANKVFQIIAMRKPVIISNSPSSKSAGFIDMNNSVFAEINNPQDIANKILLLKENNELAEKIQNNGYKLFKEKFSPSKTGKKFKFIMKNKLKKEKWNDSFGYRIRKKITFEDLVDKISKNNYFLDIGLGGGRLCLDLAKKGFYGEGIDISEKAVEIAKNKLELEKFNNQVNVRVDDIFKLDESKKFDLIFAFEVIEHIQDDKKAIEKINNLLNKNGYFIFSVPAHQKKWSVLDEWAGHFRRYERGQFEELLNGTNIEIVNIYNYGFPLINILRFIQIKTINKKNIATSKEENSKKSGIDRSSGERFKFLFNDLVLLPFYLIQKNFIKKDLSPAYLIIAKKNK